MPTINLEMVIKEYPYIKHFCLEAVGQRASEPETLSLFQVNEVFALLDGKNLPPVYHQDGTRKYEFRETNTMVYEFDCRTGAVNQVTKYQGDYREEGFRWKEQKAAEWSGTPVDSDEWMMAYHLLEDIRENLRKDQNNFRTATKEKDELGFWVKAVGIILQKRNIV